MRLIGLNEADTVRLIEGERREANEVDNSAGYQIVNEKEGNMAVPRRKLMRFFKAMMVVAVLGTLFVIVRVHFFNDQGTFIFPAFTKSSYTIGDTVKLKIKDKTLSFVDAVSGRFLRVKFQGQDISFSPYQDSCEKILGSTSAVQMQSLKAGIDPWRRSMCLKWKDTVLVVNDTRSKGSLCYSVEWITSQTSSPQNCFSLASAHWYGGSLLHDQQWPLEDNSIRMQPFVSSALSLNVYKNNLDSKNYASYGPVLERLWVNSAGFGIFADSDQPLHVSVNADRDGQLCLKSQYKSSRYLHVNRRSPLSLKYTVCMDRNVKLVHQHMMKNFITLPKSPPHVDLMQNPVWSTRGISQKNLVEEQVLTQQLNITKNFFLHSQLHIAGNFTRTVGSMFFDHERFPHAHQMVSEMTQAGFNVSVSILPVIEFEGYSFDEGVKAGAFVNTSGNQMQKTHWRNKSVATIDFTNPRACDWMTSRLTEIKAEATVRAFHFDSGEAVLLSGARQTSVPLPNPCDYSTHYVKFAHSMGNSSIVSVGYRSQQYGLMVDIGARYSSWDYQLGLKSIITSVLTAGLLGYPFVIVGPVGGVPADLYSYRKKLALPDKELYIRWLQLSMFLPGLELSVGPWQYDKTVIDMAHKLFKRRAEEIFPILQTATKEFLLTGAPIIRPLWWMATDDETAQRIDCEFLVSNKILVAPVLDNKLFRSVYLPKVKDLKWQDDLRKTVYTGGQWLHGYKVDLYEVATFRPVYKSEAAYHLQH